MRGFLDKSAETSRYANKRERLGARGNAHQRLAWLAAHNDIVPGHKQCGRLLRVFMPQIRRGKGFLKGGAPLFLLLIGGSVGLAVIIQQKIDVKVRVEFCLPADGHCNVHEAAGRPGALMDCPPAGRPPESL